MSRTRDNQDNKTSIQATFKGLTDYSQLSKALFLVSVGNKYHENKYLKASLNLLNDFQGKHSDIKNLTVLVAGTLQRYNFWLFTDALSDEELSKLANSLPADVSLPQFCNSLASAFYPHAKKAEDEYIKNNATTYYFTLKEIKPTLLRWDDAISVNLSKEAKQVDDAATFPHLEISEEKKDSSSFKAFGYYFQLIQASYTYNEKFRNAVNNTINEFVKNKKSEIKAQASRILLLNPKLNEYLKNPIELARLCCKNYLFEEAALLIPMGYNSILYPGKISAALQETLQMWSSKTAWIHIHQKAVKKKRKDEFLGLSDVEPPSAATKMIIKMSSAGNIFSSLNMTTPVGSTPLSRTSPLQSPASLSSVGTRLSRAPTLTMHLQPHELKGGYFDSPKSTFSDSSISSLEAGTSSPSITKSPSLDSSFPPFSLQTPIQDDEKSKVESDSGRRIRNKL